MLIHISTVHGEHIFALNMRLDVYTQTEPESCKIIIHFADISFATTYGLFAEAI